MAAVKVNLSLDPAAETLLRQRAQEERKPLGRYVADLVLADARRARDELAAAGYRELGADMLQFAKQARATDAEGLPEYEE